ncbi:hypothetical protein BV898_04683 [Hypsibius exemplaris]|uniref:Uncharacterized protein n=1 Tax=Hypsibius exemplaris TaxID=2072580 RepID=A0A1W0X1X6_HYPEX|nr:hypothetical protein BV898_04683 [Hypsibius exemplaris]
MIHINQAIRIILTLHQRHLPQLPVKYPHFSLLAQQNYLAIRYRTLKHPSDRPQRPWSPTLQAGEYFVLKIVRGRGFPVLGQGTGAERRLFDSFPDNRPVTAVFIDLSTCRPRHPLHLRQRRANEPREEEKLIYESHIHGAG